MGVVSGGGEADSRRRGQLALRLALLALPRRASRPSPSMSPARPSVGSPARARCSGGRAQRGRHEVEGGLLGLLWARIVARS